MPIVEHSKVWATVRLEDDQLAVRLFGQAVFGQRDASVMLDIDPDSDEAKQIQKALQALLEQHKDKLEWESEKGAFTHLMFAELNGEDVHAPLTHAEVPNDTDPR